MILCNHHGLNQLHFTHRSFPPFPIPFSTQIVLRHMLFELERGLISLLVTYMYYVHEVIKFHLSRSGLQVRKLVVR